MKNINTVGIILFSTLTIYFDQKFLIVPLVCYLNMIISKNHLNFKIFITLTYVILAIPYLYLFYKWGGIVPIATQLSNPKTVTSVYDLDKIYFIHIGYASTLLAFYLLQTKFHCRQSKKLIFKKIKFFIFCLNLIFFHLFNLF